MQPKRVLHIVGKMDRAGAETMLMNLYRHINRDEFQFDFITFTNDKGDYDDEIAKLGGKIIPIIAKDPISRTLRLTRFLKKNPEYKIVHAHMLLSNAFHLLAAKTAGVRHRISHSHNTSNGKVGVLNKAYERWSLLMNRNLATSKVACGIEAAEYLFGNESDVLILKNAVDVDNLNNIADNSRSYIQDQIKGYKSDSDLNILQVGRLSDVKNHKFSLEVMKELKRLKVKFNFLIAGKGPLESYLKELALEMDLDDCVSFLGVRTDIIQLMASADFMIMPSKHEGFPVVLVESQCTGLKSLVSDQVSIEVDLGLNLVEFLPIKDPKIWAQNIIKSKTISSPSASIIRNKLQLAGFDVTANAIKLAQTYNSFQ